MTQQYIADNVPVLATRIPDARRVSGLIYGAHVQGEGWEGYYVRPRGGSHWGVAKLTPCSEDLVGSSAEIVAAVAAELGHRRDEDDC